MPPFNVPSSDRSAEELVWAEPADALEAVPASSPATARSAASLDAIRSIVCM
jgi:hypothetical protein